MEHLETLGYDPRFSGNGGQSRNLSITIFDGYKAPRSIRLDSFNKSTIRLGRGPGNDITLESHLVSAHPSHAQLSFINGMWRIDDLNSTNGLLCNNVFIRSRYLADGDLIRIERRNREKGKEDGVLLAFSAEDRAKNWRYVPIKEQITIGRSSECDIVLPQISVSKHHARISQKGNSWTLEDTGSTNGVILNGLQLSESTPLHEKDVISITSSHLIFTSSGIFYRAEINGISVDVTDVVITRGRGNKSVVTGDHISLGIRPGELVAIIGGSGAGKSTLLSCMCGYLEPAKGSVFINGANLYQNFEALKQTFGYVPQSDIVYDNLTLWDMLMFTAQLRLPPDINPEERDAAILRAIRTVELEEHMDHLIGKLSGGQRKRASIAVELLSDPKLLFLDEPASGLDPGTERSLMQSLRKMASSGKTVVLVTHSTLQLRMCDRIAFMGKGGKLCFYGSYDEAMRFFGVQDIVDVYEPLTNHSTELNAKYTRLSSPMSAPQSGDIPRKKHSSAHRQLLTLCSRYFRLVVNDRQRLLLLLIQAPFLALLISFVANGKQFKEYEMTKSLLFALSCSAFWIGILNAIQEICKEKTILKREYMTGLSLGTYLCSKIIIMGLMCLLQSLMIVLVFACLVGAPKEGILFGALPEMVLVSFLTAISASAMGLFVSALFSNADRAMTVAPILLMPQILFSGLLFKLEGVTEAISWFTICRWSMEGYGTTADLNHLQLRLQLEGFPNLEHEAENFFEHTPEHFRRICVILVGFTIAFLLLARIALSRLKKEDS